MCQTFYFVVLEFRSEIWIQAKISEMVIKAIGVGVIAQGEQVERRDSHRTSGTIDNI